MLQVDVDALGLDALHLSSADGASHERVLRVVLEVTAGVSGAVHIDAGAVQAGVTHGQAVLADASADLVDEVNIEGSSHDKVEFTKDWNKNGRDVDKAAEFIKKQSVYDGVIVNTSEYI